VFVSNDNRSERGYPGMRNHNVRYPAIYQAAVIAVLVWVYYLAPLYFLSSTVQPPAKGIKEPSITRNQPEPMIDTLVPEEQAPVTPEPSPSPAPVLVTQKPRAAVDYSRQKLHYKDKALVLCYHHFDDKENGITISRKRFASHLNALKDSDYNVISMEQFVQFMKNGQSVPQNAILITFDDGYESVYTQAYPKLKKMNMAGTTFIVGDSIDNPPSKGTRRMKWDQIREMKANGSDIFSHTYKLHDKGKADRTIDPKPVLTNPLYIEDEERVETDAEYKGRIKRDFILMESRLQEELGSQRRLLAFPFGAYNDTALEVGRSMGYELFFTTTEGINTPGRDEVYRFNAGVSWMTAELLLAKLKKYDVK
jgi:peptidoglycan/xylan/chitin deacetylase (PgdA/CDA1 family)